MKVYVNQLKKGMNISSSTFSLLAYHTACCDFRSIYYLVPAEVICYFSPSFLSLVPKNQLEIVLVSPLLTYRL